MSGYRKLLAVGAGLGMLLVGAVAAPAAADPPNDPEVIRVQIYSVRYEGLWANARFSGACPADFPYLTDKKFSNDRILPLGVIIDTAPSVATLVVATSSEKRIEGRKEFVAVKSIEGSFTNWSVGSGTFTVTLECTSNWKKGRLEATDR
ncbi:hypothetical protein [Agromyces sp. NPDC057865]|uniref:hypothetical protein n=1 Tax=Agromyces sp. NPDC057865 TaxID=3346267 RepID=UPI00366EB6A7